ncbi:hypothetical protein K2173_005677 [Erythroxylum novogranatense]|uniref:Nuclear transcription factor Y subunit n=1 Tax=Erythroxylum novogranatense TaxID=1862640 RepID=A0AAV8SR67_9ROSI|nr:hypothetical protein K2173_005677 [Erythroxylum novogranatense]
MAMKTLFFKEHEGIVHNSIAPMSSSVPWWSTVVGSQSVHGETCRQSKTTSMGKPTVGEEVTVPSKLDGRSRELELERDSTTPFTIFPGDCKTSYPGKKPPQASIFVQPAVPECITHFELGFGHPVICAKYPHLDQYYGVLPTYGSQGLGRIMLPMNMATSDEPIFVNAKQYHGIMRRRKSRAKAVMENKAIKTRKPYMHYSRHLHAMRRPRGCGGRFLNTKSPNDAKGGTEKKESDTRVPQPTGSQSSEVLESDIRAFNLSKETHSSGSNHSGFEVTSTLYSRGELDRFPINHLAPSARLFSGMMDVGHGTVMSNKWVAAADNCCNLKV